MTVDVKIKQLKMSQGNAPAQCKRQSKEMRSAHASNQIRPKAIPSGAVLKEMHRQRHVFVFGLIVTLDHLAGELRILRRNLCVRE